MKITLTLAIGLCTASTALAASNEEVETKGADAPLISHPIDDYETMSEDTDLQPFFPALSLRDDISVTMGGRVMFDTTLITADTTFPSGSVDGNEFRRARIYAKMDISEHVSGKVQYDFAGGGVAIKDVYIKFKTAYGAVTAGHHYQPVSFEELTSSKYITFLERAMAVEAISPGRDTGISTTNSFNDSTRWALGIFRRVGSSADGAGDGDYSITGRVTHAIEGENSTTHLGISTSLTAASDSTRIRSRPEVHQTGRVVDTTSGTTDGEMMVGLEFAWTAGPNTVQAEYLMTSIDSFDTGTGPEDVDFNGYYVSYSRMLTGESRSYNSGGKWGRIKPNENWEGKGLNGAWEAAVRYSMLDLTDGSYDQQAKGITVGMNWYMNAHTRLMVNVVRSEADIAGANLDFTALLARLQIDW